MDKANFPIGCRVRYQPNHRLHDNDPKDDEYGNVTGHSQLGATVFVTFDGENIGKGCYLHNLVRVNE